ncbi:hypothetical protein D3P09_17980 [Paenibacillus pinisoli]|uniref:S-layer homology domain-containing protein n=1 Tax=Paenibacillus pinisoli TaxID=1276110 RepID=A0A3A6PN94_9BACL|nr:S-layer homology domain-containing protein [Paenibacillus pinisoli]RJX37971.1 hypothetical protein D3P09_17980 [Paenibacillus pinisoli]
MHQWKRRRILSGFIALLLVLSISPVQSASAGALNPLGPNYEMTAYPDWPSGMAMNYSLFGGGVFDGQDIWMIPAETDRVVKLNPETGVMTGYLNWPAGFTKSNGAFSGGVFDGQHIWMVPSLADRVIKLDPATGIMTGYNDWPAGYQSQSAAFSKGVFDGTYIWLIPVNANQVIRIDPATGEMTGYDQWPAGFQKENYAFAEGVFDGTSIWMIPSRADRVIQLNPATGEMTGYSDWPSGFNSTGYAFKGAVFDGNSIWMLPYSANQIVKLDTATGDMTGFDQWPSGFDKSQNLFTNGAFDGEHIWMKPSRDSRILKINPATGAITGLEPWPVGFNGESKSFNDAVYDGLSVWFIPSNADRVFRLTSVPELSAVTGGDGQATISWQPVHGATGYHVYQSLTPGGSGIEIAAVSGTESSHAATGLSNGVTYYFTVKAEYAWGESAASNEMSATPMSRTIPVSVPSKPYIDNNGIWVDPDSLDSAKPSIVLESDPGGKGSIYVTLPASVLESYRSKNDSLIIEVKATFGRIHVPVQLASLLPKMNEQLASSHTNVGDAGFKITLTDKSGDQNIRTALSGQYPQVQLWDAMADFQIEIMNLATGQRIGKAESTSLALTKLVPIPNEYTAIPVLWGAFRYEESTKTFAYAPARIITIDSKPYAEIRSYANTTYAAGKHEVSFADAQSHWSEPYVELAAAKGLVEGNGEGRYYPDQAVTRAQFAAMLVRALGRSTTVDSIDLPYQDVRADSWYFSAVAEAKKLGLLGFAGNQQFQPGQALSREEMAGMLAAALKLEGISGSSADLAALNHYQDVKHIDPARLQDVRMMAELQIMNGTSEEWFSPKSDITRAQAATALIRALQVLGWINK